MIKWKALGEQLQSEDNSRTRFVRKRIVQDIEVLPVIIRKFIGSLRKAVKRLMRVKGGTPYSIIRSLFRYWDADKKGRLSRIDLERCMSSLGIKATDDDRSVIIEHYKSNVEGEMSYAGLLADLARGEPTLIEFDAGEDKDQGLRFVEVADSYAKMPPTVKVSVLPYCTTHPRQCVEVATFPLLALCCLVPSCVCGCSTTSRRFGISSRGGCACPAARRRSTSWPSSSSSTRRCVRVCVLLCFLLPFCVRMDVEGTHGRTHRPVSCPAPHTDLTTLVPYTRQVTGSLNPREVKSAAVTDMRLMCTDAQAQEIVRYYDRKGTGEIDVPLFVSDVCSGVQSILHFEELSARGIAENKRALAENPFIIKPFKALPNKFLERFKRDVMIILGKKVRASWTFTACASLSPHSPLTLLFNPRPLVSHRNRYCDLLQVYAVGGSKSGWLYEAFRFWDKSDVGYLSRWEHVQGAVKRLGVTITQEEAECLVKEYDKNKTGDLHYNYLIKDIIGDDPHFLADATHFDQRAQTAPEVRPATSHTAPIEHVASERQFPPPHPPTHPSTHARS